MQHLPAFYYRTTLLALDDDILFSSTLTALLSDQFQVKTFAAPEQLLNYLQTYQAPQASKHIIHDCSNHDYYDTAAHTLVDINIPALQNQMLSNEKVNEVSIIISGYDLPQMNGVEVFNQLHHLPAKKILLTGAADTQIAVDAFNANIINCYIRKDSQNIVQEIQNHAQQLAQAYFIEQSKLLTNHLESMRPSPLTDNHFADFFKRWCKLNKITEYTLIDKNGSFSVLDQQNKIHHFVLHTENSLKALIDLNDDEEDVIPQLSAIKAREKIPFFGVGVDSWEVEAGDWERYCYQTSTFQGREKYYWCVVAPV